MQIVLHLERAKHHEQKNRQPTYLVALSVGSRRIGCKVSWRTARGLVSSAVMVFGRRRMTDMHGECGKVCDCACPLLVPLTVMLPESRQAKLSSRLP
jgi:hypothetical protein